MSRPTEWIDLSVLKAIGAGEFTHSEICAMVFNGSTDPAYLTQVRRSLNRQRGKTLRARKTPAKDHHQRGPRPLLWSLK